MTTDLCSACTERRSDRDASDAIVLSAVRPNLISAPNFSQILWEKVAEPGHLELDCGYRLDFVVERELIIEIKAVERLLPVHEAQLITYLKLAGIRTGLLVNFHAETLRHGLRRLTLNPKIFPPSRLPVNPNPEDSC